MNQINNNSIEQYYSDISVSPISKNYPINYFFFRREAVIAPHLRAPISDKGVGTINDQHLFDEFNVHPRTYIQGNLLLHVSLVLNILLLNNIFMEIDYHVLRPVIFALLKNSYIDDVFLQIQNYHTSQKIKGASLPSNIAKKDQFISMIICVIYGIIHDTLNPVTRKDTLSFLAASFDPVKYDLNIQYILSEVIERFGRITIPKELRQNFHFIKGYYLRPDVLKTRNKLCNKPPSKDAIAFLYVCLF